MINLKSKVSVKAVENGNISLDWEGSIGRSGSSIPASMEKELKVEEGKIGGKKSVKLVGCRFGKWEETKRVKQIKEMCYGLLLK